ncbi:MAG: FHIPEP family type III secretion protein, partial [Armatimonadota bacterium]
MQLPSATTPATPARRPGDAAIAAGVLLALVLIVLPSTPILLDLLLAANLLISTLLLLLVLPLSGPLELPSFPSLLLLTGLFRLGLAIAAARLILGVGTGGAMIEVLGSLVSGGAWVAGVGVFVVLAIVQIAVIAAGASRAAEVAARFSLDALPGKQFGIDAALSAKAIDGAAAEDQRGRLQAEADFYGAMDGAAKFARGEAVASVAIVALTFVAGAGQAVANAGLSAWQTAVNTYGVLVAGEAATILLPGLMTCYAAALMV